MTNNLFPKKTVVLFLVILSPACLKSQKTELPSGKTIGGPLKKAVGQVVRPSIPAVPQSPPVDGASLRVLSLSLSADYTGDHRALKFTVKASPGTDHLEFTLCQQDDPADCQPGESNPGIFSSTDYSYPTPPPGHLQVRVRACVREPNAENPGQLCGPWEQKPYVQQGNTNLLLAEKMEQVRINEAELRQLCHAFFINLRYFFQQPLNPKSDAHDVQQLYNMMHNTLQLGEDRFFEMVNSGLMDLVEQEYKLRELQQSYGLTEQEEPDYSVQPEEEERKDQTANAAVLLGMGSLAILGGGAYTYKAIKDLDTLYEKIADIKTAYRAGSLGIPEEGLKKLNGLDDRFRQLIELNESMNKMRSEISSDGTEQLFKQLEKSGISQSDLDRIKSNSETKAAIEKLAVEPDSQLTVKQKESLGEILKKSGITTPDLVEKIDTGFRSYRNDPSFSSQFNQLKSQRVDAENILKHYADLFPARSKWSKSSEFSKFESSHTRFKNGELDLEGVLRSINHDGIFTEAAKVHVPNSKPEDLRALAGAKGKIDILTKTSPNDPTSRSTVESETGKIGTGVGIMVFGVIFSVLGTSLLSDSGKDSDRKGLGLAENSGNRDVLQNLSDVKEKLDQLISTGITLDREITELVEESL